MTQVKFLLSSSLECLGKCFTFSFVSSALLKLFCVSIQLNTCLHDENNFCKHVFDGNSLKINYKWKAFTLCFIFNFVPRLTSADFCFFYFSKPDAFNENFGKPDAFQWKSQFYQTSSYYLSMKATNYSHKSFDFKISSRWLRQSVKSNEDAIHAKTQLLRYF